jgi:hypothetical protein
MFFVYLRSLKKQPVSASLKIGRPKLLFKIPPENTPRSVTVAYVLFGLDECTMAIPVGDDNVVYRGGGLNAHPNYSVSICAGRRVTEAAEVKSRHRVLIKNP